MFTLNIATYINKLKYVPSTILLYLRYLRLQRWLEQGQDFAEIA